jgi:hypothetical protein
MISKYLKQMKKSKKYRTYLSEAPNHYDSIMRKHGMPPTARPPETPKDILELIKGKL